MSMSYLPATMDTLILASENDSPSEAISILYRVLANPSSSPEALNIKEQAIIDICYIFNDTDRAEDLRNLVTQLTPLFSLISKAKTARIVRDIIDVIGDITGTSELQISLCKELVQWTRAENRTSLRYWVEARLAALLIEEKDYSDALNLLAELIKEVGRMEDKLLLIEINLLESKIYFCLRNLPMANVALYAARITAQSIYVPIHQQGAIDLQSGILHAEEKDYCAAFHSFAVALTAFDLFEDPRAVICLKYLLLCVIMCDQSYLVQFAISRYGECYDKEIEINAMKAVAYATHSKRCSIKLFKDALRDFRAQLQEDLLVHLQLSSLYNTLFEKNLYRLIEPFSRVEIVHVANLIELPVDLVESKLSQMILDKKLTGNLDQGCLIIFDDPKIDGIYAATLETIINIGKVVDSLYVRSTKKKIMP
ncbi:26S proteasome non-ATPase regulatory subunit 11 homolog [Momordica charantia]|uniref:26S proteasome non-ATPase regulatory subunit 11 homolog n=1 Tax=Momordica charantia TaxID=3673 RepID=A0A6J1E1C5_MOMCH|nr:26S proteasome non-ATPase regulatory subunit 11 homolog [Momordica charantia]